jgi:methylated-DNA-[protein]-cysteine S-methyltransferase
MIERKYLDHLSQAGNVRYSLFNAPTGDMYILGDDSLLKSLIFKSSLPRSCNIKNHFLEGTAASINDARNFLDVYFGRIAAPTKTRADKHTLKVIIKKLILSLEYDKLVLQMDVSEFTQKEISVYRELLRVPHGATISYGALAARAGIPGGARFIGNTMAKNNFPIIIPCHRVIISDGTMGNYSGGKKIKALLLDHERSISLPLDRAGRL